MYSGNSNGPSGGYSGNSQTGGGGYSGNAQGPSNYNSGGGYQQTGGHTPAHSSHYSPRFHHHHSGYSSNVSFQSGPVDPCRACCTIL